MQFSLVFIITIIIITKMTTPSVKVNGLSKAQEHSKCTVNCYMTVSVTNKSDTTRVPDSTSMCTQQSTIKF